MKKLSTFVCMAGWVILISTAQGQKKTPDFSPKQYVVKVNLGSQARQEEGILYNLTDSTIVLMPKKRVHSRLKEIMNQHTGMLPPTNSLGQLLPVRTYRSSDINRVTVHRKNSLLKGFLIGDAVSTAIMVVFNEGDKKSNGFFDFPSKRELHMTGIGASVPFLGIAAAAVMTKTIKTREQSSSVEAQKRFRKFTIVEQAMQAELYSN